MRRSAVRALTLAAALAVALPTAASAHDDHPGRYIPSPEGQTQNMKLLGSAPKTSTDPTYRNSDLAFWGRYVYAGNYLGFRIIDASAPGNPKVIGDVSCPGAQHDVSVWNDLVFLSIDAPRTKPECDGTATTGGAPGFEGIRIFNAADPANPVFVKGVATDCGSHTHTLVPDLANNRVLLYVASYPASAFGPTPYGTNCQRLLPDGSQGHSKISIVAVPLDAPEQAAVVSQPTFELNDLRDTPGFRGCHDITVFLELQIAAAACLTEGQMWDISDPLHPVTTARIHNPNVEFWHSSAFTWDGKVVAFGDEAGGGTGPRCRAQDPATLGAMWFYDVAAMDNLDGSTVEAPLGSWKTPRVQGDLPNCTTHNFNVIPVRDRYVIVVSSYAAGTSVVDFTDPSAAYEAGFLDPHGANTWSAYWYDGFIYTNDGGRGVDVMLLSDRLRAGARKLGRSNPQTQEAVLD